MTMSAYVLQVILDRFEVFHPAWLKPKLLALSMQVKASGPEKQARSNWTETCPLLTAT